MDALLAHAAEANPKMRVLVLAHSQRILDVHMREMVRECAKMGCTLNLTHRRVDFPGGGMAWFATASRGHEPFRGLALTAVIPVGPETREVSEVCDYLRHWVH